MKIELTNVLFFPITLDPDPDSYRDYRNYRVGIGKELIKLMMRTLIFLFCTTLFSFTPKNAFSQNDKIVIDIDKVVTVDEVFDILKTQTDYTFIYHEDLFKNFPKVQLKKGIIRANKLLEQILSTSSLDIIVTKNNKILIKEKTSHTKAQQRLVSGTVTDQSGSPVPGATVLIKGTYTGTTTDFDGHYTITVPNPENVLVFSFLGFETQEITVGTQTTINVSLKESISALDEVIIKGYYNTTQREQTGSVAKIDAKVIEKQPVDNPLAAMQGYLPGVNITQDSGVPGGAFNIEIRGRNSLSSKFSQANEPLYIIDGVPYSNESLLDPFLEGTLLNNGNSSRWVSPLNVIDPSSIQSIEVLKDADATAIYGARGANGVVLITTKKGKAGKSQIKLNMATSLGDVPHFMELLSTEQYLDMRWEGIANDGYTPETVPQSFKDANPDLFLWDQDRYTDWQEVFFGGTAYRRTANLSFTGGNENTQFLFSGGYLSETSITPGDSEYKKATMHTSINHQSTNQRLKVNVAIDYGMDDNNQPAAGIAQLVAIRLPPNAPATHDENGNISWEGWSLEHRNPMAQLSNRFLVETKNFLLNSVISYTPITRLEFKTNLGYTDYRLEGYSTDSPSLVLPPTLGFNSSHTSVSFTESSRQSWIVEPQVNWHKDWDKANIKVLLGTSFQKQQSKQLNMGAIGFDRESQIYNPATADNSYITAQREKEYYYQSFFGRLNLNWDSRYFINLTGRRDGSSRFAPGRQFGNFGAVGVAWIFSEAAFFKDSSFLSFGKLRSSYGITGSDNIGDYQFYDAYQVSEIDYDGSTWEPKGLYNPIFQWESNKKFEVALELGFLKDRIFLTAAWYQNRSSNQLTGIPLPGTTGFSNITGNFDATVENSGLEIDFKTINIQNKSFNWTTTFNITANRNKLVKYDGLEDSPHRNSFVVGQPISIQKFYNMIGVDPETGLYRYEDYNGDGRISSPEDRQFIVNTAPKFYGGFGNAIRYKNLTLDVFFQFKKHKMRRNMNMLFPGGPFNQHVSVLDRWQQIGDQAPIQRFSAGLGPDGLEAFSAFGNGLYVSSSAVVKDASFIRLRNVSLSYALPKAFIQGMDLNVYLQGQNLLTFTKYEGSDPDLGFSSQPLLRRITMGLQLGF